MNKLYLIILISLISNIGYSQEISFDIHNTSLSDFLKKETKLGSEKIPTTSNHVSFSGDAQPIKFKRKEKAIPDLIVYYFFKEKDSTMSSILYEWDVYNFEKKQDNKQNKIFRKKLAKKYLCLEKELTEKYGKAESTGALNEKTKINSKDKYKKNDKWFPNDSTEIEMYIVMSNLFKKNGMVTTAPTHKIRLYVKSKKKIIKPKLNELKVKELDVVVREFLKSLEQKDLDKIKPYFSEIIKNQIKSEVINELVEFVDFNKEIELEYQGIQMGMNGISYVMLNYKYTDDKESPPSTIIKFIFDDKDKIIGFRPMKRSKMNK